MCIRETDKFIRLKEFSAIKLINITINDTANPEINPTLTL